MKYKIRNLIIFVFPFLLMVTVNEIVRLRITTIPYSQNGVIAINSVKKDVNECSWICHNNTGFCKANHTQFLKPYFKLTDPIYFGVIGLLQKTGNYGLANIIFLVILVPFLIWFFLVKSMSIQEKISNLKKKNGTLS